ncbi:Catechol dioxygenase N terminus [Naganishia albida]|nr:Catechol dioxygenase N terminus [Naganishia albida]
MSDKHTVNAAEGDIDLEQYTQSVIASISSKASPRVRKAFPILIKKLHEFIVEADVTVEEWLAACALLVEAGQVTTDQRDEMVLVSDVLGVESLVDILAFKRTSEAAKKDEASQTIEASHSAILGPFYRHGVAVQPNGTTIVRQFEKDADYTRLFGTVYDAEGKPLKGAMVDIWHDAPDGLYDAQDPSKPQNHCRGRFQTDENGRYETVCLRPTPYPIPFDHSAGKLLQMMGRHPYRPAHIHFWIEAPGHKTLVSQVFDRESDYLKDDAVFAVKDSLVIDFVPIAQGKSAKEGYQAPAELKDVLKYELQQDFRLTKAVSQDEPGLDIQGLAIGGEPAGKA